MLSPLGVRSSGNDELIITGFVVGVLLLAFLVVAAVLVARHRRREEGMYRRSKREPEEDDEETGSTLNTSDNFILAPGGSVHSVPADGTERKPWTSPTGGRPSSWAAPRSASKSYLDVMTSRVAPPPMQPVVENTWVANTSQRSTGAANAGYVNPAYAGSGFNDDESDILEPDDADMFGGGKEVRPYGSSIMFIISHLAHVQCQKE